jgi:tRNA-2-methylthio-N6-dimethylallyladenosine synthase
MDIVRQVNYSQCYSFKYSPRPGTPGSIRTDQVPEEVKTERLTRLQALIVEQQVAFNRSFIGKEVEVLLDRTGKLDGQFLGKTPYMQSVHLTTKLDNFGNLVNVRIKDAFQNSLSGEIVDNYSKAA